MTKASTTSAKSAQASPAPGRVDWATRINGAYRRGFLALIETGRLLIEAKTSVAHGEWLPLVETLEFSRKQAERLMRVARDERFKNATKWSHLPPGARTLEELSRLDDEDFEDAVEDGTINPEMTFADAAQLRAEARKQGEPVGDDREQAKPWRVGRTPSPVSEKLRGVRFAFRALEVRLMEAERTLLSTAALGFEKSQDVGQEPLSAGEQKADEQLVNLFGENLSDLAEQGQQLAIAIAELQRAAAPSRRLDS